MLLYQLPFRMDKAGMNSSKCKGDAVSIWIDRRVYLACNIPVQLVVQLTSTELLVLLRRGVQLQSTAYQFLSILFSAARPQAFASAR